MANSDVDDDAALLSDDDLDFGDDLSQGDNANNCEEEDDDGDEASSPRRSRAAGKKENAKASAKGKAKAKSKAASKVTQNKFDKKKRGRVVNGKKWCRPCQKWLPLHEFPVGSAHCAVDRKVVQNLRNASIAQDQMQWYDELMDGPDERIAKVVKAYKVRVADAGGKTKKAGSSPILQYEEEVKQGHPVIVGGVYEMMHKAHYIA